MKRLLSAGALIFLVGGCDFKLESSQNDCSTVADCNPGKTCGDLVMCVDGKCDPSRTVSVECNKPCSQGGECPEGTFCRNDTCVPEGYCEDAGECEAQNLGHAECEGEYACEGNACKWKCVEKDYTVCSGADQCVLVTKECCGCGPDYAINKQYEQEWWERCAAMRCPAIDCQVPPPMEAVCEEGHCKAKETPQVDFYSCEVSDECVKVDGDCCGCSAGGTEVAVNRNSREEFERQLQEQCALIDIACQDVDLCTDNPAACVQGKCTILRPGCGDRIGECGGPDRIPCPEGEYCRPFYRCVDSYGECVRNDECEVCSVEERPVCGADGQTYRNECVAGCMGVEVIYQGKCECMIECFRYDPVCGANGVTYGCGRVEAECNGVEVVHEGECGAPWCSSDCAKIDPVCVEYAGGNMITIWCGEDEAGNIGGYVRYHGRCDCQLECARYEPVCAANGITYSCGRAEAECNGVEVLYDGMCRDDEDCDDICNLVGGMPVCGKDFKTYSDACARCRLVDVLHEGACLEGEGYGCGGEPGSCSCPGNEDEYYCLGPMYCCDFPGVCVKKGACDLPADCERQGIDTPPCVVSWQCVGHSCEGHCGE